MVVNALYDIFEGQDHLYSFEYVIRERSSNCSYKLMINDFAEVIAFWVYNHGCIAWSIGSHKELQNVWGCRFDLNGLVSGWETSWEASLSKPQTRVVLTWGLNLCILTFSLFIYFKRKQRISNFDFVDCEVSISHTFDVTAEAIYLYNRWLPCQL